jgi:hypothetical protein
VGDGCADGTACVASLAGRVCAPITATGNGHACDGVARTCAAGLGCDPERAVCLPLGSRGDPCSSSDACDRPYACVLGQCIDPQPAGSRCSASRDCAPGLTCAGQGGRRVPTCVAPVWASPGASCDDASPCLVGACSGNPGTCPRVLADDATCVAFDSAATCASYSACMDGRCAVEYSVPCP